MDDEELRSDLSEFVNAPLGHDHAVDATPVPRAPQRLRWKMLSDEWLRLCRRLLVLLLAGGLLALFFPSTLALSFWGFLILGFAGLSSVLAIE